MNKVVTGSRSIGLLEAAQSLLQQRQLEAAIARFDQAEGAGASQDSCSAGRWSAYMLLGEFVEAWRESDAIRLRGAHDPHRFWQGQSLHNKRVILRCLHGFGDAVQLLRYVPRLRAMTAELLVEVPPAMLEIAPYFAGVELVTTWGESKTKADVAAYDWEVQCEIMELPYIFRTQCAELPLASQYLHLPAEAKRRVAELMGPRRTLRVGVVWAAGEWNKDRSIDLSLLLPLLHTKGCEFWSLQGGSAQREWSRLALPGLRDAAVCGDGMLPLAATIAQLDLVITVDTLAAHLVGSMGIPAWVMLQQAGDWRWMTERSDSPWYPSLQLFRQPVPGDWASVIESVQGALQDWMGADAAHRAAGSNERP